ncbi:hypothetical protein FACS1894154_06760 [Betaproteobacteria bacterium]|nr:hypothetical protein FACS1894154_06760 [Betaproteobacteria bacterium]GHU23582.1 hypothetical protein FACS189488_06450 [Betaproteobacteria bacterium]GHU29376.1 hypothetical protein FACS189497_07240 [Betaproteobacteria bacterium]
MNTTLAWQEYCKNLAPALQTACKQATVSSGIGELLTQLANAQPEWPFQHRLSRGGWYRPGGVVDAAGNPIADNLETWAEAALDAHAGDLALLLEDLETTPRYATRFIGSTHYLIAPTGEGAADFLQLEIEQLQETGSHRLGEGAPNTPGELLDPLEIKTRLQAPLPTTAHYHFRRVIHVGAMLERMCTRSPATPPIQRLLDDWQNSSAGIAAPFHQHWLIAFREYLDRYQQTQYRAQPIAAHTDKPGDKPPAFALAPGANGLKLHAALQAFDRETGYPFAWFFHLLTTKAIPQWVAQTTVEDALNGFAYLPQRDVDIVRNWLHRAYVV